MKLLAGLALTVVLTCATAQSANTCNSLTPKIEKVNDDISSIKEYWLLLAKDTDYAVRQRINMTRTMHQCMEEIDSLKTRQAAAALIQISQLLIFLVYLLTICIYKVVKCSKKVNNDRLESQMLQMEARLQERKRKSSEERKRKSSRSVVDDQLQ